MSKSIEKILGITPSKTTELIIGRAIEAFFNTVFLSVFALLGSFLILFFIFINASNYSWEIIFFIIVSIINFLCWLLVLNNIRKNRLLANYLKIELRNMMNSVSSGSNYLTIGAILSENNLFIPLKMTLYVNNSRKICSVDLLLDILKKGNNILLLGDAGQGKTIVLNRLFKILSENYINAKSDLFPVYIPLREIGKLVEQESFDDEEFFSEN